MSLGGIGVGGGNCHRRGEHSHTPTTDKPLADQPGDLNQERQC